MNWPEMYKAIHKEYLKHDSLCILYEIGHILGGLCIYGCYAPRILFVNDEKKYIYFVMPKAANSSILSAITGWQTKDDGSIHARTKRILRHKYRRKYDGYYKFSFVRNPLERLYSCYENKYHDPSKWVDQKKPYKYYLLGYMKKDNGFDEFIKKIVRVPDLFAEKHFKSQFSILYSGNKKLVDYIGKFENLSEDFKPLKERFGFSELPYLNGSKNNKWQDFYTLELAELVHERYKKDFELFGYEEAYEEFCEYLRQREKEDAEGSQGIK